MTDSKDIAIQSTFRVPDGSVSPTKPCYAVIFTVGPSFIALELPLMEASHIKAKGFFIKADEDNIAKNFPELISTMTKDKSNVVEMYFPWTKVHHIRNLVYKYK